MNAPLQVSEPPRLLVETSALVAVALQESDWVVITEAVSAADCVTTSFNVFEAVLAVSSRKSQPPAVAHEALVVILEISGIEIVYVTPEMLPHAVAARQRYGHGRRGPQHGRLPLLRRR